MKSLNAKQQECYDFVVNNPRKGMCRLVAPGGCGKSYLIKQLMIENVDSLIILLAPTNKACDIYRPGVGCSTIHRFFNARQDYTEKGDVEFYLQSSNVVDRLIIVDEASMISRAMFEKFKLLSEYNLIMFAGDKCQIPPIKEAHSLVFSTDMREFQLTENMRSRDSLVRYNNTIFRNNVLNGDGEPPHVDKISEDEFYKIFDEYPDSVVLSWTNSSVQNWNKLIRKHKFGVRAMIEDYFKNEILIFSGFRTTYAISQLDDFVEKYIEYSRDIYLSIAQQYGIESDFKYNSYYSSDLVHIMDIKFINVYIPYFKCNHQLENKKKIKCKKCMLSTKLNDGEDITFYLITDQDDTLWFIPKDVQKINKIFKHFKEYILKQKTGLRKLWRSYYLIYNLLNPELRYSYASTIHKAQGSEYDSVFVDIKNIRRSNDSRKLSYTAVSRAKKILHFV